ncbi:hypothetical protein PC39_12259 [Salinisphaera sp. PC39]|uniref:tetratricopeptide repeat protein n=1 Tax=Salinisphaera sp. PC39 TaxID=1304156 RepID=UPI00333E394A
MKRHDTHNMTRGAAALTAVALLAGCAGLGRGDKPEPTQAESAAPAVALPAEDRTAFDEAVAALRAGDNETAESRFAALAQRHPELAEAHANRGLAALRAGDDETAREAMARAVELEPDNAAWQNRLGVLLRRAGEFERAEAAYEAALDADGDYPPAHLNLGILYDIYLQRPQEALSHYQQYQTLAGQPDDEVALWIADLERRL